MAGKTYPLFWLHHWLPYSHCRRAAAMLSLLLSLNVPIMSAWWSATVLSRVRWILK